MSQWQLRLILLVSVVCQSLAQDPLGDSDEEHARRKTLLIDGSKQRQEIEPGRTFNYNVWVPANGGTLRVILQKYSGDPMLGVKRGMGRGISWSSVHDKPHTDAERWDEEQWVKGSNRFEIKLQGSQLRQGDYCVSVHNWDKYYQDNAIYDIFATYNTTQLPVTEVEAAPLPAAELFDNLKLPNHVQHQLSINQADGSKCNCDNCDKQKKLKIVPSPAPAVTPSPTPEMSFTLDEAFAWAIDWTNCNTELCQREHARLKAELDKIDYEIGRYKELIRKDAAMKAASKEKQKCQRHSNQMQETKKALEQQLELITKSDQANAKRSNEGQKIIDEQARMLAQEMDKLEVLDKNIKLNIESKQSSEGLMDEMKQVKAEIMKLQDAGKVKEWRTNNVMHKMNGSYPGWIQNMMAAIPEGPAQVWQVNQKDKSAPAAAQLPVPPATDKAGPSIPVEQAAQPQPDQPSATTAMGNTIIDTAANPEIMSG